MNQRNTQLPQEQKNNETGLHRYEPPTIVSYTEEQILEDLGPAQAGSAEGASLL